MTDENIEDKYPHWRTALFGNHNAVANIRCAIHYVFWHFVYGLIGAVGVIALGATSVLTAIAPIFGPLSGPFNNGVNKLGEFIDTVLFHPGTEAIINVIITFVGFLWVAAVIIFTISNPLQVAQLVGVVIMLLLIFVGGIFSVDYIDSQIDTREQKQKSKQTLKRAGKKATETPGIRRVYGKCPVKIKNHPKWFDNLFNEEK